MIVVTNRIPVAEGFEEDFENRFRNRAHLIDKSPGFVKNTILRPIRRRFDHATGAWVETQERGYYLVQTTWESEEDFWNWTKSESFRRQTFRRHTGRNRCCSNSSRTPRRLCR